MKKLLVLPSMLILFVCYGQSKSSVRSTKNAEDRKYFMHKMDSLLNSVLGHATPISDKEVALLDKEVPVQLSFKKLPYKEMRKDLDDDGYSLPVYLYQRLLKEFPQFERFSLITNSTIEGKTVKITYCFFPDNTIAYYNETEGHWSKFPFLPQIPK